MGSLMPVADPRQTAPGCKAQGRHQVYNCKIANTLELASSSSGTLAGASVRISRPARGLECLIVSREPNSTSAKQFGRLAPRPAPTR